MGNYEKQSQFQTLRQPAPPARGEIATALRASQRRPAAVGENDVRGVAEEGQGAKLAGHSKCNRQTQLRGGGYE